VPRRPPGARQDLQGRTATARAVLLPCAHERRRHDLERPRSGVHESVHELPCLTAPDAPERMNPADRGRHGPGLGQCSGRGQLVHAHAQLGGYRRHSPRPGGAVGATWGEPAVGNGFFDDQPSARCGRLG
jgi:hypothetical protein